MGNSQTASNYDWQKKQNLGIGDDEPGWLFQVLEFCDMPSRSRCVFLSKRHHKMCTSEVSFKWRLIRLQYEHGIYFPASLPAGETYMSLYLSLVKHKNRWAKSSDEEEGSDQGAHKSQHDDNTGGGEVVVEEEDLRPLWQKKPSFNVEENFNVSVCARFKPRTNANGAANENAILPLHQTLALIRASNNLTTNREALGFLTQQGGWFKDKWEATSEDDAKPYPDANISDKGGEGDHVEHLDLNKVNALSYGINEISTKTGRVVVVDKTIGLRGFNFDHVFADTCEQQSVYDCSASRLVCDFINGFNATCLVYGMTGSGKTFTMFGPPEQESSGQNAHCPPSSDRNMEGIVPRACKEIMDAIKNRKEQSKLDFDVSLSASFVEIYGNQITDLLKGGAACGHSKVAAQRHVLDGAADVPVRKKSDAMALLKRGEAQKRKAATAMNERSSRAHSVFILTLRQRCIDSDVTKTSKLFLADLGGCEQTKKSDITAGKSNHIEALRRHHSTPLPEKGGGGGEGEGKGVVATDSAGSEGNESRSDDDAPPEHGHHSTGFVKSDRMREAVYINLGLMALKDCVKALNSGNPRAFVPYANSKLTMMLSSGLGGNSKTSVIVCAAQDPEHVRETVAAMRFGQSCRNVSNRVKDGSSLVEGLLGQIDGEIAQCEELIKQKERWEVREEQRVDSLAEAGTVEERGFGGVEVRKTTVLVGAEEERMRLDRLLQRRSQLTGGIFDQRSDGTNFGGVIGFGDAHRYGLGDQFVKDNDNENYRFLDKADKTYVPQIVKERGDDGGWKTGDEIKENREDLERRAKTVNRNKLVYSGLSA